MSLCESITFRIEDGACAVIYCDAIADLARMGEAETRRASHVEPAGAGWEADMSPSGGPVLSGFSTRGEALQAEVEWLKNNRNL